MHQPYQDQTKWKGAESQLLFHLIENLHESRVPLLNGIVELT